MREKKARMFVKRPVIVEAFQFGHEEEPSWFRPAVVEMDYDNGISRLKGCISTLEGDMWFWEGDYVIRGVKGECYPCRRDIFEETYNEIDSSIS